MGEIIGFRGIGRDVTGRKKAEESLAEKAIRRRILMDKSRDGISVLDENSKLVEANQRFAEMMGYTPEELRELHSWDWDTQWTREELLEMGRSVDEDGRILYANRALLDMWGYSSVEELEAVPAKQLYTSQACAGHMARFKKRKQGEYKTII